MTEQALEPLGSGGVGRAEAEPRDPQAFVEANLEWLLLHALASLLSETFGYAMPDADAADAFASSRMSARHEDGEAAKRLALVAEAFVLAGEGDEPAYFATNELDAARAFRVLCVANGADNAVALSVLPSVEAPNEGFDACRVDRDLATEQWDVTLSADFAFPGDPPGDVTVSYGDAEGEDAPAREVVETSGLLQTLAEEVATTYALFDPLVLEARSCDADSGITVGEGKLSLCYSLVRELQALAERPAAAQ